MTGLRVHPRGTPGPRSVAQIRFPIPPLDAGRSTRSAWRPLGTPLPPLRCRLGWHTWLPLEVSLRSARYGLTVQFCRSCSAERYVR
jgi:hypothetical protein